METIIGKGIFCRNRWYWIGIMMLTTAFSGVLTVLFCGNQAFRQGWEEFLKTQELPGLVLRGGEEGADDVEQWMEDHEKVDWVCVGERRETAWLDGEEKTVFLRGCLREGRGMWQGLEKKKGISPYYHIWFGGRSRYGLELSEPASGSSGRVKVSGESERSPVHSEERSGAVLELPVAQPSLLFLGAYQWEQIPSAEESYCEVLLEGEQYEALFGTAGERSWYIRGDEAELKELWESAKEWEGITCQRYEDSPRYANARELGSTLDRLASFFTLLFAAAQWLCLTAAAFAVREIRRDTDRQYRRLGADRRTVSAVYAAFLGSAVLTGVMGGWLLGRPVGIRLAQEGLGRLGIMEGRALRDSLGIMEAQALRDGLGIVEAQALRDSLGIVEGQASGHGPGWRLPDVSALVAGSLLRGLCLSVPAVLPAVHAEHPRLLRAASLGALFLSALVMTAALTYEASRETIMDHLFEERYGYRQQVLFDNYLEQEQAERKLNRAGIQDYEFMAGLWATVRHGDRQARVWVVALEDDSRAVKMYGKDKRILSLTPNQVVLSSETARKLQVKKGDILSYEALAGGRRVEGSCLVADVSEQYSQFAEYIRLDDVTGFLQSSGVATGCFLMEEADRERLSGIRYFGDVREQRRAAEESFDSVKKISRICCAMSVFTAGFMTFLFLRSLRDAHRGSCRFLRLLGQSPWEIRGFLVRWGAAWLPIVLAAGIAAGTKTGGWLLRELSSDKFLYPTGLGGRPQAVAFTVLATAALLAGRKAEEEA